MLLRQVLAHVDLPTAAQDALATKAKSMRPGAAGVEYGRLATIIDAARLIKEAWAAISATTISNAFAKANLRSTYRCSKEVNVNDDVDFLPLVNHIDGLTMEGLEEYLDVNVTAVGRFHISRLSSKSLNLNDTLY